jgi:hypothetical protein
MMTRKPGPLKIIQFSLVLYRWAGGGPPFPHPHHSMTMAELYDGEKAWSSMNNSILSEGVVEIFTPPPLTTVHFPWLICGLIIYDDVTVFSHPQLYPP